MKIVFFGTSPFAAKILETLRALEHTVVAIVTRPDRQRGRDLAVHPSAVKQVAIKLFPSTPIFQPEKASTEAFCLELKAFEPELFLVVAYGEIIRTNLLSIPTKACVNIHASLLPEYRGAAPIQRCIMDGKKTSGITFMEMVLQMDAGAILKQVEVPIPEEMNVRELEAALLSSAEKALPEFLLNIDRYLACKTEQIQDKVSFAAKITPQDSVLDWTLEGEKICNQIRGLSPSPGVFIKIQFGEEVKRLKILSAKYTHKLISQVGILTVSRSGMEISCKDGFIEPLIVQLEGKRAMKTDEFLRGVSKHFSLVVE
jgi:methionyl-tRNA formyltransferase